MSSRQLDVRNLSSEADRNATNPYPIYCAIEKKCFDNGPIEGLCLLIHSLMWMSYLVILIECDKGCFFLAGQWFEVTPHEAGFPAMELFVETSLLGSKFQGGELLERKSEMDMVELQGAVFVTQ